MKISVAMSTFDGELHLREQLESIAAQTRPPDEVVVCDDGSSDETRELLEQFVGGAPFVVRLNFNQRNLGSNKSFAQAINLCEGDIIALCDQDDVWHPEKLAAMEATLIERPDAGLVFTNGEVIDENSQPANYSLWQGVAFGPRSQAKVRAGRAFAALGERPSVTGAAMAFRSRYAKLVLPIPDDIGIIHDEWIALLIAAAADLAMIDKPLIKYRLHPRQQIGVSQPSNARAEGIVEQVRQAIKRKNPFLAEIKKLRAVEGRLAMQRDFFSCENSYRTVRDKISHLEFRVNFVERGFGSASGVLRELLTLRYHRYSRGLYSALKDLRYLSSNRAQST
jgi:glycosyltransferase involved in cell wall biosynthesis